MPSKRIRSTVQVAAAAMRFALRVVVSGMVLGIPPAEAAPPTCPFNIPVVALPPYQAGGFSWGSVIRPQGDPCVASIAVDPTNDAE